MRHLSGLLPEGLKQEMYGLWEVNSSTNLTTGLIVCRIMTETCVICRNMKLRAVQRPSWWNSLTSWRWSCRLTSTKSWRERREDSRSSSTPPAVSLRSVSLLVSWTANIFKTFEFLCSPLFSGRFHHPDVLQLISSLNEERGRHMNKTDTTKNSGNSETSGGASARPHSPSHTSWL